MLRKTCNVQLLTCNMLPRIPVCFFLIRFRPQFVYTLMPMFTRFSALLLTPCLLVLPVAAALSPVEEASPMVGTDGHGHTYPGATTPFGFVQASPDTRTGGWDACSGYHYSDSTIEGFSH